MNSRVSALIGLFLSLIVSQSCNSLSDSSLGEIKRKRKESELCGVKSYKRLENKACGTIYQKKTTHHCGVHSYHKKPNKKCPGYRPSETKDHVYSDGSNNCPDGFRFLNRRKRYVKKKEPGRDGSVISRHSGYWNTCVRDEVLGECELKEHGVEEYKQCRHRSHGVERYRECERPEHGVAEYKACLFYKTPDEALEFAKRVEQDVPMIRDNMLIHHGNFYMASRNKRSFGNIIKKFEGSPLYREVVSDMKTKFSSTFGEEFVSKDYDGKVDSDDISKYKCKKGNDNSHICKAAFGYQRSLAWFNENIIDLMLVRKDMIKFKKEKIATMVAIVIDKLIKEESLGRLRQADK